MKKLVVGLFFLLSLTLLSGNGFSSWNKVEESPPSKEQMEKIRKRVASLRMWRLTQILDLNSKTASKLFPVINEYDKRRLVIEQIMGKNMRRLRSSVETAGEDELHMLVNNLKNNHWKLQEINNQEMEKLEGILSVRELARFMIFKQDFDQELKRTISRVKEKRKKTFRKKSDITPPAKSPLPTLPDVHPDDTED
jgi:hypothetical protein